MAVKESRLDKVISFSQVLLSYHTDESLTHFALVKAYTKVLCKQYNRLYPEKAIDKDTLSIIVQGAELHDIGKIYVANDVLNRKNGLTENEFDRIKHHTTNGGSIINRMAENCRLGPEKNILFNICMYHHERWDGSGYPEGLAGDAIPLEAQIVSIAEVYSALTEDNYRKAMTHEEAMRTILAGESGQFNPVLLKCLEASSDGLHDIQSVSHDKKRIGLLESMDNTSNRFYHYWQVKRFCDVCISAAGLVVLSPLLAAIALAVFIDDPKGSPIFKQTRLGRHSQPFTMYKFRSMVVNAEAMKEQLAAMNEKDGPVFKIAKDPRITRVGRFIRATNLDELPQLFNVLKGDMSLVGPRPPLPKEVKEYSRYHEIRLSITPGLTCIWQIQPQRDLIGFEEWMDMDVTYIATHSLKQDALIILKTIGCIFRKTGT